jgi:hypothetical protein
LPSHKILRSQAPLAARTHSVEIFASAGHVLGEIGGSGPQSVGAQAAASVAEPLDSVVVVFGFR